MRRLVTIVLFLLLAHGAVALSIVRVSDSFYPGSMCTGGFFDCGTSSDGIVDVGGTIKGSINDDTLSTYVCLTATIGGTSTTQSCIIRQGFNDSICDPLLSIITPGFNKTGFYTCPSANLSTCSWNITAPAFVKSFPSNNWSLDSSLIQSMQYAFSSYYCNVSNQTVQQGSTFTARVVQQKSVTCAGSAYQSIVTDTLGSTNLGGTRICSAGFCDPTRTQNYTTTQNITGDFCTGGCSDNLKNGLEIETDYGGAVCGNCTVGAKANDQYYQIAKELQEGNSTILTPENPFNPAYCATSQGVVGGASAIVVIVLLILFFLILLFSPFFIIGVMFLLYQITRFIRKKDKKV